MDPRNHTTDGPLGATASPLAPKNGVGDRPGGLSLRACLLLLPTLALATGILSWAPYPRIDGTGLAYLVSLPVYLVLASRWRAELPRFLIFPLLLWLVLGASALFGGGSTDELGRTRALVLLSTGLLVFLGGMVLCERGRVTLTAGLLVIGLAFGLPALSLGFSHHPLGFAGVLGNVGSLSQVLVPAGAASLALLTRVHGKQTRILAAAVFLVVAIHAASAPVHTGSVSLLVVALLVTLLSTVKPTARIVPFSLALFIAVLMFGAGKREAVPAGLDSQGTESEVNSPEDVGGQDAGLKVRFSIARASLRMWREVGQVGAGQFQAAIPPFREVEETEVSRDGVCQGGIREVEHPHNDWLLGFVELGLLGGSAWLALLILGGLGALRSMRYGSASDAALGAALVGMLVNATAHGPFLISPASSALGFALLGAIIRQAPRGKEEIRMGRAPLALALGLGLIALSALPSAIDLFAHGRGLTRASVALAQLQDIQDKGESNAQDGQGKIGDALAQLEAGLGQAQRAFPHSALLLRMQARFSPAVLEDSALRTAAWDSLLAQQPYSFEALYSLGLEQARIHNDGQAQAYWETALALQPTHPVLLRNLARLAFHAGDDKKAEAYLLRVQSKGCLGAGWIAHLGAELVFAGRLSSGRALLERDDPRLADADAAWLEALAREAAQAEQDERADALYLLANLDWAREHVATQNWSHAARLYRQALNRSRRHTERGAACLALEFAAAQLQRGDLAAAQALLEGLNPNSADLAALPAWALEALRSNQLLDLADDPQSGRNRAESQNRD